MTLGTLVRVSFEKEGSSKVTILCLLPFYFKEYCCGVGFLLQVFTQYINQLMTTMNICNILAGSKTEIVQA